MMALLRWFYLRVKRILPVAVIVICLYMILKYYTNGGQVTEGENGDDTIKLEMPPAEPEMERWVVVWTAEEDGLACRQTTMQYPGWRVLIVGTKHNYTGHSHCVYFTSGKAAQFSWTLANTEQAASDLTLAYLYLVEIGAPAIYIPPPGSPNTRHQLHLSMDNIHRGLVYSSQTSYDANILAHFGCKDKGRLHHTNYIVGKFKTPALQVPIRFNAREASISRCDAQAPPVTLNKGTYVMRYSFHGALYLHDALWALPVLEFRNEVEEVAWMLAVQHLLWMTGDSLQLWHNRFNEDVFYAVQDEKVDDMAHEVQETLRNVECIGLTFGECVSDVLDHLHTSHYMDENVMQQIKLWISYLKRAGYTLISEPLDKHVTPTESVPQVEEVFNVTFHPVDYNQVIYTRKGASSPLVPTMNLRSIRNVVQKKCAENKMPSRIKSNFTHPWHQFEGTLLLVTFNMAHYEAIPFVEGLYRALFPYILYCGPDPIDYDEVPILKEFDVSFVTYGGTPRGHWPGAFNYDCVALAESMQYPVTGFLTMSDDMLLSVYKLRKLPLHQPWYLPPQKIRVGDLTSLRECKLGMCDFFPHWRWWEDYQTEIVLALQQLRRNAHASRLFYKCYTSLVAQNGAEKRANGGFADFHYLPAYQVHEFATLARFFRQHEVFLEITVPTIFTCLNNPEDITRMPGIDILDVSRDSPWQYFTTKDYHDKYFLHPTKWGYLAEDRTDYKDFYCSVILPFVHDSIGRIR